MTKSNPTNAVGAKSNVISFNEVEYRSLRLRYNKAVKEEAESFTFNDHEYLTAYARYLLEYLNEKFE